ncbi:hypothetical protein IJH66_03260 [Candidatus Saccharibacteria bacterium]|nr:hypothetical protein [Candidatus Saccharibacteria bacterium]MBQ6605961.1 hypothetical protein [Candidatus Saccharibacteria bacterium]
MKNLGESFKKIYQEDRGFLGLLVLLFLLALALFIFAFVKALGVGSMAYVGYSDIGKFAGGEISSLWSSGGYRSGGMIDLMAFAVAAVVFGLLHSLISVQIYERRGKGVARMFVLLSAMLVLGAFVVLIRLLGEG